MSKKTVAIIIAALIVTVGIFAYLNSRHIAGKKEIFENAEIVVKEKEREVTFSLGEIKNLGQKEFRADLKASGKSPEQHNYTGVPLKNIIEKANINIKDKDQVVVRSVDGFAVALGINEVLEDDNIYLAYMIDGQYMDSRDKGGSGPYQVIIRQDQFSQRWAKYVMEIEL